MRASVGPGAAGGGPGVAYPNTGARGSSSTRQELTATAWFDYLFASPEELAGLVADTPWTLMTLTHVERDDPNYLACLQLR